MKTIELTKGMVALVDDEDYARLSEWSWFATKGKKGKHYARTDRVINGVRTRIYMHGFLLGAKGVDHKNGDTLDNQKRNLRVANQTQNMSNQGLQKHNRTGLKGVRWDKSRKKWAAAISNKAKHFNSIKQLGRFDSALEAALAYDAALISKVGEFAVTNKSLGLI